MDQRSLSESDICARLIASAIENSGRNAHSQIRRRLAQDAGQPLDFGEERSS